MSVSFSNKLINWYNHNKRDLPWRKTKDPYKIWVSEIILQQTRIEFGIKYYNKFLKRYPNVKKLQVQFPNMSICYEITSCSSKILFH